MNRITILGATGSIGKSTLDVIARNPESFEVFALGAHSRIDILSQQCRQFRPRYAVVVEPKAAQQLQQYVTQQQLDTEIVTGADALLDIANHPDVDTVVAAVVGAAGLLPTFAAVQAGKRILLANKEALVMSGELFMREAQNSGAEIIPVDSEHNALFQCMPAGFKTGTKPDGVKQLILTASGGPFRTMPLTQLSHVTAEQACAHPNWKMGQKVSVDSATMINKALEIIEAYWLFNMDLTAINVLLHPQSIVHSLVEYDDGSVLAQLGNPDMRTPIAAALAWPKRIASGVSSLDLIKAEPLNFEQIPSDRYPGLQLAYDALKMGGTATTVLNAANEIAVQAFLNQEIRFTDIATISKEVLEKIPTASANSIETILDVDQKARIMAKKLMAASLV